MKKMYALRSAIVHGGGKKPSLTDTQVLCNYIQRAIKRVFSLRHLSKNELVEKLDREKK